MKKALYYLFYSIISYGIIKGSIIWLQVECFHLNKIFGINNVRNFIHLRKQTTDKLVFRQIFFKGEYSQLPFSDSDVIIDAGANIGLFGVLAKSLNPEAKLICIEPDKDNCDMIKKNLRGFDNVYIEEKGLWHKETPLDLSQDNDHGEWAIQVEESLSGKIEAVTIEGILEKYQLSRIDILKIDIETSEKQLFATETEWLDKVHFIVVEFHDRMKDNTSMNFFKQINNTLRSYNYYIMGENTVIENLNYRK